MKSRRVILAGIGLLAAGGILGAWLGAGRLGGPVVLAAGTADRNGDDTILVTANITNSRGVVYLIDPENTTLYVAVTELTKPRLKLVDTRDLVRDLELPKSQRAVDLLAGTIRVSENRDDLLIFDQISRRLALFAYDSTRQVIKREEGVVLRVPRQ